MKEMLRIWALQKKHTPRPHALPPADARKRAQERPAQKKTKPLPVGHKKNAESLGFFGVYSNVRFCQYALVEHDRKPEIRIPTPNIFDIERDELLAFLPYATVEWLIGALLALYDEYNGD